MAASIFDSPLYAALFPTGDAGRLFSDSAVVRAMLLVEGALAKAQGQMGLIPETSAAAIHRASLEVQIDPGALTAATGENGVCVPALVDALRAEMNAPEHAQFVHWGATSQDIIDSGLMLRLRQTLKLIEEDMRQVLSHLADQAERHAETPMAARTYGQVAVPTTWGAVLASWGNPLCDTLEELPSLRERSLWVSLGGAAGTASALGQDPSALRKALAEALGLHDPLRSWHTDRGPILRITDWMARILAATGSMGDSLLGLASSGIEEVSFGNAGGSSTMPHKENPVAASALIALGRQSSGTRATLATAGTHQHQRDAGAWFAEWMAVPQMALSAAAALRIARELTQELTPRPTTMAQNATDGLGLIYAEALSFELAKTRSRPEAQALVKDLCTRARTQARPLSEVARSAFPDLPDQVFSLKAQLGEAPQATRAFVTRVRAI